MSASEFFEKKLLRHQRKKAFLVFCLMSSIMISAIFYYTYIYYSPINSNEIPTIKISYKDEINRNSYVNCTFELESNDELDNIPQLDSKIKVRGRLNAELPKKGYCIELSQEKSLLGMRKDDDWVLLAMYRDLTNMRIKLSFDLWRSLGLTNPMAILPETKYVILFINGQFKGLFLLAEKNDRRLFNLDDAQYNYNSSLIFQSDSHKRCFEEHSNKGWDQDWPNEDEGFYLKDDIFSKLVPFIRDSPDVEFFDAKTGIYSKFDKLNLIDFLIYNYFILHKDFWSHNFFLIRNSSPSKFILIPWDFDISFGQSLNRKYSSKENPESEILSNNYIYRRLMKNKEFMKDVKERWLFLRESLWMKDSILDMLLDIYEEIKNISEIDMNMWYPWYLDMEWELKIDEAVEKLFEWIPKRLEFCDSYFLKF